jgi:hypothetical protein
MLTHLSLFRTYTPELIYIFQQFKQSVAEDRLIPYLKPIIQLESDQSSARASLF